MRLRIPARRQTRSAPQQQRQYPWCEPDTVAQPTLDTIPAPKKHSPQGHATYYVTRGWLTKAGRSLARANTDPGTCVGQLRAVRRKAPARPQVMHRSCKNLPPWATQPVAVPVRGAEHAVAAALEAREAHTLVAREAPPGLLRWPLIRRPGGRARLRGAGLGRAGLRRLNACRGLGLWLRLCRRRLHGHLSPQARGLLCRGKRRDRLCLLVHGCVGGSRGGCLPAAGAHIPSSFRPAVHKAIAQGLVRSPGNQAQVAVRARGRARRLQGAPQGQAGRKARARQRWSWSQRGCDVRATRPQAPRRPGNPLSRGQQAHPKKPHPLAHSRAWPLVS